MANVLAEFWLNQAHKAIPTGYASAIQNYSSQKEAFLQRLQIESNTEIQNFIEQLNNEIANETSNELDSTFDSAFEAVRQYLEEYIVKCMEDGNANYDQLLTRFKQAVKKGEQGSINPDNLYKNLTKEIENFLAVNNVTKSGLAQYVASVTELKNTTNTDIQNNLFGYARRLILQQLQGQGLAYSTQHYKTALKGYYKEELLVPALNKLLQQYGLSAIQMGSTRNDSGQQIKYDIILGTSSTIDLGEEALGPMLHAMEALSAPMSSAQNINTYYPLAGGLQSKSWIAPWSTKTIGGNRNFLQFGHNAQLMPQGVNAHYWHAGVYNVMSNLTTAIGPGNFLFSTGDTVYWTADLLSEFRERQYVLAFYYNKTEGKITSGSITAQPHND